MNDKTQYSQIIASVEEHIQEARREVVLALLTTLQHAAHDGAAMTGDMAEGFRAVALQAQMDLLVAYAKEGDNDFDLVSVFCTGTPEYGVVLNVTEYYGFQPVFLEAKWAWNTLARDE